MLRGYATLQELEEVWSFDDYLRARAVVSLQDEAQRIAAKKMQRR